MSVLAAAFLVLLSLHVAYSVYRNRRRAGITDPVHPELYPVCFSSPPFVVTCLSALKPHTPGRVLAGYLQLGLFALACVIGVEHGIFSRRLVSPLDIGMGVLIGHLVFGASLLITQASVREAALHLVDLHPLWSFIVENPAVLMQYIAISVAEEMMYRVSAQPALAALTGSPWMAVVVVAIAFCIVHEHFFKNPPGQSAEFFLFAVLLGALYYWTGSLILVIVVHAVRNIEIAFLEEWAHAEACGGEGLAEIEREYRAGHRAAVLLAGAGLRGVACFEYVRTIPGPARAMEQS
ncbi:MAG TPA: CPBP family intramembrane metalloprotease [Candidatus Hydrogenedentes bacterium]|nr:CPBP family intramembrane metalloprotease [Candidatus Hydrogenedentota bacterium]HOV72851.1 CPBP family intramembrane metalloprotease [Candidatus Hydrogenedentota bacterium]